MTFAHQKKLSVMKKDKNTTIKDFKAVEYMRNIRDQISKDIEDMDYEEIKAYFKKRRKKLKLN